MEPSLTPKEPSSAETIRKKPEAQDQLLASTVSIILIGLQNIDQIPVHRMALSILYFRSNGIMAVVLLFPLLPLIRP